MDVLPPEIRKEVVKKIFPFVTKDNKDAHLVITAIRKVCSEWNSIIKTIPLYIYSPFGDLKIVVDSKPPLKGSDYVFCENGKFWLFRREYYWLEKEKIDKLASKNGLSTKGIEFWRAGPKIYILLHTKYELTNNCMYNKPATLYRVLRHFRDFWYIYSGTKAKGELIREKYPNHYSLFNVLYQHKQKDFFKMIERVKEYLSPIENRKVEPEYIPVGTPEVSDSDYEYHSEYEPEHSDSDSEELLW